MYDLAKVEATVNEFCAALQLARDHGCVALLCGGDSFALEGRLLANLPHGGGGDSGPFVCRAFWFHPPQIQTPGQCSEHGWCTLVFPTKSALWGRVSNSSCMAKGGFIGAMPAQQVEYDEWRHVLWKIRGLNCWKSFFAYLNMQPVDGFHCLCVVEPRMAASDLAEFVFSRHVSHMTQAGESGDENVYKSSLAAKVFCGCHRQRCGENG